MDKYLKTAIALIGAILAAPVLFFLTSLASIQINSWINNSLTLQTKFTEKQEYWICKSFVVRCLEVHEYESGSFAPKDDSIARRIFMQALIPLDGGASYLDLDKNRIILDKSRISSP